MSYNYNESQASFKYLERGLSEVCVRGMDADQHTIVATSSAPTTVTSVVPFHYLINEQAKSIAALQELQNEVTALLEFRDLVMETFPHLRTKTEPSTPTAQHYQGASSLQNKRDWEPGIRVRRKLRDQDTSLVPRSRSNSHGKAPKSEAGNSGSSTGSSAVQDSGFCTESKEHCSTSTTSVRKTDQDQEAEDELWTLLEVIHCKGTKLRLEVENLQERFQDKKDDFQERRVKSLEDLRKGREPPRTKCHPFFEVEVEGLRKERDLLLDRVTEMEAENLANLATTNDLLAEMGVLTAEKCDLEEQLKAAIHTKAELNNRIHDLHSQFVSRSENKFNKTIITPFLKNSKVTHKLESSQFIGGSHYTPFKNSLSNEETVSSVGDCTGLKEYQRLKQREEHPNRIKRTSKELTVLRSADSDSEDGFKIDDSPKTENYFVLSPRFLCGGSERLNVREPKCVHMEGKLGALDGVVSTPSNKIKGAKGVLPDRKKTAAILKENNIIELRRHLLTTSFDNQVIRHKLKDMSASRNDLSLQLEKVKEDNEDLRFQLEEKSIELEGTRARVRLLERLQGAKLCNELSDNLTHTLPPPSHESTPAPLLPRLNLPLPNDDTNAHHSSSTESAHNEDSKSTESPRKRPPSKIPLKSYIAPKPPSGKGSTSAAGKMIKDTIPSWSKKEKSWDPVTRSIKNPSVTVSKRESPRPASRESVYTPSTINRRIRKTSNQDGSFSSTNSTPSMRRDPPSSPAPKKIPSRERIINSDSESKVRPSKLSFWSNWLRMSGPS